MGEQHGEVHWTELSTRSPEKAAEFYAATLGWRVETMPMPDGGVYRIGFVGDAMAAGIFEMAGPQFEGMPDHWGTYFAVDDVDASVAQVKAAGGKVLQEPFDVEGVGRIAMIVDSVGAICGFMTPSAPPTQG